MKKVNLILADDHKLFRKGLSGILADYDEIGEIMEVENGEELLEKFNDKADVVLLDIEMPGINGLEALKVIKNRRPEVKIIVLSMHTDENTIVKAMEAGCNTYLPKDSSPDELVLAITKCVTEGKYINDKLTQVLWENVRSERKPDPVLSEREIAILQLICQELTSAEIAERLHMSTRNVDLNRQRLMEKLEIKTTVGLVKYAIEKGYAK